MRAMVAIARRPDGYHTGARIASEEGVSKKYLDSILGRLRETSLVDAVRGSKGGYRLARPASDIAAADVVEALDGPVSIVPCVEDSDTCERASRCPTRHLWQSVSDAARDALDKLTLAELAANAVDHELPAARQ